MQENEEQNIPFDELAKQWIENNREKVDAMLDNN